MGSEGRVDENSKRTRVEPVFGWLREHGDSDWPARLIELAHGLDAVSDPGSFVKINFEEEVKVPASHLRLAWLIENAEALGHEGSRLQELTERVISDPRREEMLEALRRLESVPDHYTLEGATHADCLIECERAIIWVEGKRTDWLSPGTKWDSKRDQLARNLEAAWIWALEREKDDFCVVICHEVPLRSEEQALVDGYRAGALAAGVPHLADEVRREFTQRIGTLTWSEIVAEWPAMRDDERLASVASE